MILYFIKVGNKFITKTSTIKPDGVFYTFYIAEARYWEKLSTAKGIVTKLKQMGITAHIAAANVIEQSIYDKI